MHEQPANLLRENILPYANAEVTQIHEALLQCPRVIASSAHPTRQTWSTQVDILPPSTSPDSGFGVVAGAGAEASVQHFVLPDGVISLGSAHSKSKSLVRLALHVSVVHTPVQHDAPEHSELQTSVQLGGGGGISATMRLSNVANLTA
eukprot:gnl/MRDRNA2_/MRDRNA2_75774_c0_seq1.p1 gnl/MRDRNA2_/MRDRNA2_75774_c0~~gnl/MRDRNA2_/MRDRNA2_75774_c0_seq1.p1  ORF type:complete len:156 (+),score=33.02 gnl/MRDRNA2_/MRDRNA2_75774_c0_seq1:27-470(+)